jgi:hypothetical protein
MLKRGCCANAISDVVTLSMIQGSEFLKSDLPNNQRHVSSQALSEL